MSADSASTTPQHIAIIMDGNRRWARQHKLEILKGHTYVADRVLQPLVEHCITKGIKFITLWAFSTENWSRDQDEVQGLMELFRSAFHKNATELHKQGVRLHTIGDLSRFPQDLQQSITQWLEKTATNDQITVTFALNYGGRDEILRAVNSLTHHPVTATDISNALDTHGMPDVDLIIRPGGEQRLSGFMPWQAVYAELYFTDVLMPDFSPAELEKALQEYAHRQRRFGG